MSHSALCASTGAGWRRSDGARWLKSVLLALCLDVTGITIVGSMLKDQPVPGLEPAPSNLRVRLGAMPTNASLPHGERRAVPQSTPATPLTPVLVPAPIPEAKLGSSSVLLQPPAPATGSTELEPASSAIMLPAVYKPDTNDQAGSAAIIGSGSPGEAGNPAASANAALDAELLRRIDAIVREKLVYPPLARKRSIEGVVQLLLLVGEDGRLVGSSLAQGSGSPILDKAAAALVEAVFPLGLEQPILEPARIRIGIAYSLTD